MPQWAFRGILPEIDLINNSILGPIGMLNRVDTTYFFVLSGEVLMRSHDDIINPQMARI
jgi:hypothetical protein